MEIAEIKVSFNSNKTKTSLIKNSVDAHFAFLSIWDKGTLELQEEFKVIYLNRRMQALGSYNLSKGGISQTVVDSRLIFSVGMKCNACSILVAHNHPSGNCTPSQSDKQLTQKLKEIGELVNITLNDHLIITNNSFYSFADQGLL